MTNAIIYGIKNCDTMKKAIKWLNENNIDYTFHDYKKDGIDEAALKNAINVHGWDVVINKRGTTWRNLSNDQQDAMNDKHAIKIAQENPSIVKRPLLVFDDVPHLGFKPELYAEIFAHTDQK